MLEGMVGGGEAEGGGGGKLEVDGPLLGWVGLGLVSVTFGVGSVRARIEGFFRLGGREKVVGGTDVFV